MTFVKKRHHLISPIVLGCLFAGVALGQGPGGSRRADLSKMVFLGDSLTAGYQNFSLLDSQQVNGYAALLAGQAGTPIVMPLMASPGVPNVLQLVSPGPPPVIAPAPGATPPLPRLNPTSTLTDFAVPGMYLKELLTHRPDFPPPAQPPSDLVQGLTNLILGFPSPYILQGVPQTQVEQAVAAEPTTIVLWAGNNDVLFPELFGPGIFPITPIGDFQQSYDQVLDALSATGARLVVANIPDVTLIPYLTPATKLAQSSQVPIGYLTGALGIQAGDSLRPSALPIAAAILSGSMPGPLPATCPPPIPGFPPIACIMTADEILQTRLTVAAYNAIIADSAFHHNAAVVDIFSLVNSVAFNGVQISGRRINLDFLNGFVSLDGMHPTNTGYAIIANEFIKTMNRQMAAGIPPVSVERVAQTDPLFPR